ncbi:hypothetical protein QQP08_026879, partial [Theobroma cacao]
FFSLSHLLYINSTKAKIPTNPNSSTLSFSLSKIIGSRVLGFSNLVIGQQIEWLWLLLRSISFNAMPPRAPKRKSAPPNSLSVTSSDGSSEKKKKNLSMFGTRERAGKKIKENRRI